MLFPSIAAVTAQSLIHTEEKAKQILVDSKSDSRFINQKRHARRAVSNESTYEIESSFFIDVLPEFLRVDLFAKKVTQ